MRLKRTIAAIFLLAALPMGCAREAGGPRPDIIIYLVDTLRADRLEPYGCERLTSPSLSAFAERAIVYEHAYSPSSWTKPSVASLLTGLYPSSHLALEKRDLLPESVVTAAEYFRENGYETAAIVSSPWIIPTFRFDQGFDHFEIVELSGSVRGTRASDVHVAVARYLASREGEARAPLFLYVHTRDPHAPYAPPREHLRAVAPEYDGVLSSVAQGAVSEDDVSSVLTLYDAEIHANDAAFGALMGELASRGMDKNAAIVFTADHGEEFMEHGLIGHGKVVWNVAVHIPLVIKMPGDRFAGTRITRAASLVDVLPALGEIAGLPPVDAWEGESVLPAAAGTGDRGRSIFVDESRDAVERFAVIQRPWKGIYETRPAPSFALYHLADDPGETKDVGPESAVNKSRSRKMIETIEARRLTANKGGYWCIAYADTGTSKNTEGKFMEGEITVLGKVVDWETRNTDDRDSVEIRDDNENTRIQFRFAMDRPQDQIASTFRAVDPKKLIRFETDPPAAAVTVSIAVNGDLIDRDVFLVGAERTSVSEVPASFAAADPALVLPRTNIGQKRKFRGGAAEVLFGYVAPGESATIDEHLRSELRALGYLD